MRYILSVFLLVASLVVLPSDAFAEHQIHKAIARDGVQPETCSQGLAKNKYTLVYSPTTVQLKNSNPSFVTFLQDLQNDLVVSEALTGPEEAEAPGYKFAVISLEFLEKETGGIADTFYTFRFTKTFTKKGTPNKQAQGV